MLRPEGKIESMDSNWKDGRMSNEILGTPKVKYLPTALLKYEVVRIHTYLVHKLLEYDNGIQWN
jgi:hypothetical protein